MFDLDVATLDLLAVIGANIIGAVMVVPQAARLLRQKRVDGVSPAWAGMSAAVNTWWVAYALGSGNWAIVPVGVVSVAAYLTVVAALVRHRTGGLRPLLSAMAGPAAASGVVPIVALTSGDWPAVGVTLGLLYGVQLTPAVLAAYRSADVRGISTSTWVFAWSEAFLFGFHGLHHRDAGLTALAVTGMTMAGAILVRLWVRRPRRPAVGRPVLALR